MGKYRFRGRQKQEIEELLIVTIRLAQRTIEEHQINPNQTSPKEVLMAGILLYLMSRDAV
jgi:hypothetical protein